MDIEKIVMHIVGNCPQFIKLAPLSKELHRRGYKDVIVHTGQHYDENMSDIFFKELGIDKPVKNLQVGSGTHAEITAKVMMGVERVVLEKRPLVVVVYGDTDTTLTSALACRKLNVPLIHVEAGARTYSKENLYIGGLGKHYRIHKVFEAVKDNKEVMLAVCCWEADWEKEKTEYIPFLSENISIVHKKGKELEKLYEKADICLSFFELDMCREIAMPY